MIISMEPLSAETIAALRAPVDLPGGMAFQPISLEAALDEEAGHRLIATIVLSDGADSAVAAGWIWDRIADEAPLVVSVSGTRARVAEAAAIAWLIDRGRTA